MTIIAWYDQQVEKEKTETNVTPRNEKGKKV